MFSAKSLKDIYDSGFVGASADPRADEEFEDSIIRSGGNPNGAEIAHQWEFADSGKGKLVLPFLHVETVFPGCWPGPPQNRGDCVAKGCANALLLTTACEIVEAKPDEITGKVEGAPQLSREGVKNIPIASESLWAWRGHGGEGWVCSKAAMVSGSKGFLVRKPYPDLGIDLTKYTKETNRLGGSRAPGRKWLEESQKHTARTATTLKSREEVRDFLHAGYGVFNCSNLGFSSTRKAPYGFSSQKGRWAHSQSLIGWDERPETVKKFGQPLVCWLNSWGKSWNSGPRQIYKMPYEIPHGSFWALSSTLDQCRCIALSSVAGWPARKLPSYGATGNI